MVRASLALVVWAACQGGGAPGAGSAAPIGRADAAASPLPIDDAALAAGDLDAGPRLDDPELPDPGRLIVELAAIPAWQAVVDRAQLLGRRRQRGVVYGRVGPAVVLPAPVVVLPAPVVVLPAPVVGATGVAVDAGPAMGRDAGGGFGSTPSPYVWLIDDTEGNGALAIRIALGARAREGDRIAAGGAWQLDAERRWYWKPDAVQILPPAPPSDAKDPPRPPGHVIATGELPSGARTIGVARDGDAAYFQLVGPAPARDGDGWLIADQLGDPAVAVLNLPGERASYGGQDLRAADERWQLRRGQTYWVRLGKLRKRGADKPALVNARTAPIRVL
jgi:hypothetical protein